MIVYQLYTVGVNSIGGKFTMHSRKIFKTKPTDKDIEIFEISCYDDSFFEHAEPGTLKTLIRERELC